MPGLLPQLYCSMQDVFEMVGADAAQLRLDDQNQASGQTVQTTSDSPAGSTSIQISALQYPMLMGTNLVFQNAGMANPVEVTLSAVANAGATSLSVLTTATDVPAGATAQDNGTNVWLGGLIVKSCNFATDRINTYCCGRYQEPQLATSVQVNLWATIIASRWLGMRLYRAAPQGIEDQYKETMEELKEVRNGDLNLNLATRTSDFPSLSNISLDDGYTYRRLRVDMQTSEPTPTQYDQQINWASYLSIEW